MSNIASIIVSSLTGYNYSSRNQSTNNIVYVDLAGSDISGSGVLNNPYLTVSQAMTNITGASVNNTYCISIGSGVDFNPETTNMVYKPYVWACNKY